MSDKNQRSKRRTQMPAFIIAYIGVTTLVFSFMLLFVLPPETVLDTLKSVVQTPGVMSASTPHMVLLWMVASMMSLLGMMLWGVMRRDKHQLKVVRARRGTAITETLITFPPFVLLTFGLAQLSINSIAQILANVAVHRAAHSVWVWEPETGTGRAGSVLVANRACVSVANVMTPVAPGDYTTVLLGSFPNEAKRTREGMVFSQIPFGNAAAGLAGSVLSAVDQPIHFSVISGGETKNSMNVALDDSSFLVRSAYKFTTAYHACKVTFGNTTVSGGSGGASVPGYDVQMTYYHQQAMPMVGRYFSGWWNDVPFLGEVEFGSHIGDATAVWQKTGRVGKHFLTIKRTLPWPKQIIRPNSRMPNNMGDGSSGSDPGTGGLQDTFGGGNSSGP